MSSRDNGKPGKTFADKVAGIFGTSLDELELSAAERASVNRRILECVVPVIDETCRERLTRGTDKHQTIDEAMPLHPEFVYRALGGQWRGWNDFFDTKPESSSDYAEHAYQDVLEDSAWKLIQSIAAADDESLRLVRKS
ncbi:MAG: hypothetical protein OXG16_06390 [Rhodospirillales bacterium]|nr:hypothetical protein [Rhodospirillales bacterium]MDE0711948.1 hypothetical protein [Rhodospirillales bacterium]